MLNYDVIIIGGGPTGAALGIELGLNGIKTLILEKYASPLISPRAQLINARSMEFFMRWQLDALLKEKEATSNIFINQGVWCSKLNGETYAVSDSNAALNDDLSPQKNVRIPLWITEKILRNRLQDFPCVTYLKEHEAIDISPTENIVTVKNNSEIKIFQYQFLVGCDGVNSVVRNKLAIPFKKLAPTKRVISIVFEAPKIEQYITVTKGCLFFLLDNDSPSAIGSVDPNQDLWYAQIIYTGHAHSIEEVDLHHLLEEISGVNFPKKIIQAHFWDMQIQLADHFSNDNRIFLLGDSAHGFVPTGALGLNTGFADVVNLGWKLAAVIKTEIDEQLLRSYELERRPICIRNLEIAQRNADDMASLRKNFPSKSDAGEFAKANAELAKQFTRLIGVTMGYAYFDSHFIQLNKGQDIAPMPENQYLPTPKPGYFLPHVWLDDQKSIYRLLTPVNWTLLISGAADLEVIKKFKARFQAHNIALTILNLNANTYNLKYILIRPDWHIAFSSDEVGDDEIFDIIA
jgi:2-polyprenyl-6-methoxyphenol hydroxylase-like FAD-dependent oxidoreductase